MKGVAIISSKGGVGKTTLCHLLAVGAAWHHMPSYLMHTDDRKPMTVNGRPYAYLDARDPETLSRIMGSLVNDDGLCVIDGGGNREEFDRWIAEAVDLVLVPVVADTESVELALETMQKMEGQGIAHARYLINMASPNKNSRLFDFKNFYSKLEEDKVAGQIKRVEAVKRLGLSDEQEKFSTPPTNVNALSRTMYRLVSDVLSLLPEEGKPKAASALR